MSDGQSLTVIAQSGKVGRPLTIRENDMYNLMSYFKKGYSVSLACVKAGIPRSVFYAEMDRNEEFRDKITASKDTMTNRATRLIEDSIRRGNVRTAMWLLDRQDRRERNAQRAKEYRLIRKLTVTKTYQETQSVELEIDTVTD
jgi:hypothetical protein